MSLDIRVIHDGPLYERLCTRWNELEPRGYISAQVLFLATPGPPWGGFTPGVWFLPILIGLFTGPQGQRNVTLAQRLLEATLRFMQELDGGEPMYLEVPDLAELWPAKPKP